MVPLDAVLATCLNLANIVKLQATQTQDLRSELMFLLFGVSAIDTATENPKLRYNIPILCTYSCYQQIVFLKAWTIFITVYEQQH